MQCLYGGKTFEQLTGAQALTHTKWYHIDMDSTLMREPETATHTGIPQLQFMPRPLNPHKLKWLNAINLGNGNMIWLSTELKVESDQPRLVYLKTTCYDNWQWQSIFPIILTINLCKKSNTVQVCECFTNSPAKTCMQFLYICILQIQKKYWTFSSKFYCFITNFTFYFCMHFHFLCAKDSKFPSKCRHEQLTVHRTVWRMTAMIISITQLSSIISMSIDQYLSFSQPAASY